MCVYMKAGTHGTMCAYACLCELSRNRAMCVNVFVYRYVHVELCAYRERAFGQTEYSANIFEGQLLFKTMKGTTDSQQCQN